MPALNRAEARDVIRRDKLNLLTSRQEYRLFGTGENQVGEPASTHPFPDNETLDSQMDLAADYLNRKCRLGQVYDVEVTVAAQTTDGPFAIPIREVGAGSNGLGFGDVNSVKRVYYDDGTDTFRLSPSSREVWDRKSSSQIQQTEPAQAREFWIEGYTLYLYPPPDTAGTLHLIAGTGIIFVGDAASFDVLPNDYHDVLWTCTAWFVARNSPNDVELTTLAGQLAQLTQDGVGDILRWKRDVNAQEETGMVPASDRVSARRHRQNVSLTGAEWADSVW